MIAVDTNTIAYLLIPGKETESVAAIYERNQEWIAPLLWRSEFCSVLSKYLRQGSMHLDQATALFARADEMMSGGIYLVDPSNVLSLVVRSRCSSHDCEYVALAQDFGVPLVTSDKEILENFPSVAVRPGDFLARMIK